MKLERKAILVTGATSGMGAATARLLAEKGAHIMLFGRNRQRADVVQQSITDANGVADIFIGDVADSTAAENAVAQTVKRFGHIYGLVNAAGVIYRGDAVQTTDQQWREIMDINVNGTFYMSRAAVRAMKQGGSIINFASTCGLVGATGLTAYCASKGAIVQLTRAMALDHAADNIRVNAVCPGAVDTPMLVSGHERTKSTKDTIFKNNITRIPQNRIPTADEVANLVLFLCSDLSTHITGTNIPVDGGYTAQ